MRPCGKIEKESHVGEKGMELCATGGGKEMGRIRVLSLINRHACARKLGKINGGVSRLSECFASFFALVTLGRLSRDLFLISSLKRSS